MVNKEKLHYKRREILMPGMPVTKIPDFETSSKVIDVTKYDYRSGIVLDSLKDLEPVLTNFINYESPISPTTYAKAIGETSAIERAKGLVRFVIGDVQKNNNFKGDKSYFTEFRNFQDGIMEQWKKRKSEGKKVISLDDIDRGIKAKGTNLTGHIQISSIGEKYVLYLCDRHWFHSEDERKLAYRSNKIRASRDSGIEVKLSTVKKEWVNFNLAKLLKDIVPTNDIQKLANHLGDYEKYSSPEITFSYQNKNFQLDVSMEGEEQIMVPDNETTRPVDFLVKNKTRIIGRGFNIPYKSFSGITTSMIDEPAIRLSVYSDKKHNDVADAKQINILQGARDYLAKKIKTNSK